MGISPEALGRVTSWQALEEVGPDEGGRISPEDFGLWFSDESTSIGVGATSKKQNGFDPANVPLAADRSGPDEMGQPGASVSWDSLLGGYVHSMMHARKLLCLDFFNVNDLIEMFAEVDVMVRRGEFVRRGFVGSWAAASTCTAGFNLYTDVMRSRCVSCGHRH